MPKNKMRLDKLLLEKGLVSSRRRAQALVMEGKVKVDDKRVTKPGTKVDESALVEILEKDMPFVSRGGVKLAHALDHFRIRVDGVVAMDVGASTGGFTDCLLQRGAEKVFAVDVGYGQLDWKLRNDSRVIVLERENIRYLTPEKIPEPVDIAVIDVSFISLRLVIPAVEKFLAPGGKLVALIKPQFEVGKGKVGKGGVVRDPEEHRRVVAEISEFVTTAGWDLQGIVESPLLGPKGNREFFLFAVRKQG